MSLFADRKGYTPMPPSNWFVIKNEKIEALLIMQQGTKWELLTVGTELRPAWTA